MSIAVVHLTDIEFGDLQPAQIYKYLVWQIGGGLLIKDISLPSYIGSDSLVWRFKKTRLPNLNHC